MKDATNGDTPRGAVSMQRSEDFRMGKPDSNVIRAIGGKRSERKHPINCRKRKQLAIPLVVANESGTALAPVCVRKLYDRRTVLEKRVIEGDNPVIEIV